MSCTDERLRRSYEPDDIRVLFVGESPPHGGTFFYRANSQLYFATREAFERAIPPLRAEDDFLQVFKRLGCYLEDLSLVPVNHLDLGDRVERYERRKLRRHGIQPLAKRMRSWRPRAVAVVLMDMVRTGDVQEVMSLAGHELVERVDLPFPGRHHDRYVIELEGYVRSWRRRQLFHPEGNLEQPGR